MHWSETDFSVVTIMADQIYWVLQYSGLETDAMKRSLGFYEGCSQAAHPLPQADILFSCPSPWLLHSPFTTSRESNAQILESNLMSNLLVLSCVIWSNFSCLSDFNSRRCSLLLSPFYCSLCNNVMNDTCPWSEQSELLLMVRLKLKSLVPLTLNIHYRKPHCFHILVLNLFFLPCMRSFVCVAVCLFIECRFANHNVFFLNIPLHVHGSKETSKTCR